MRFSTVRLAVVASVAAITLGFFPGGGPVDAATSQMNGGVFVEVPANPSIVRQTGHIPASWHLRLDQSGKAILFIQMYDGRATINGVTSPYRWVSVSAVLDSSRLPRGITTSSDVEGIPSDLYLISWSTDNAALAAWMRNGTGLGSVVSLVPGLSFTNVSSLLDTFTFATPAAAPSPLRFSASLTPAFFPISADAGDFWRETSRGTVKVESTDHDERLGVFAQWHLSTTAGSPLAVMMGSRAASATCSVANVADPLLGLASQQINPGCLAREAFSSTTLTKRVLPAA